MSKISGGKSSALRGPDERVLRILRLNEGGIEELVETEDGLGRYK